MLSSGDWNWSESEQEFKKAIALNPNYATAHQWYGDGLLSEGRLAEADAEMKRAQELDPLSLIINSEVGADYIYERQYDKALVQLNKTLELDPNFYYARWNLGYALAWKGSYAEPLSEYETAYKSSNDPNMLGLMGHAYAHLNRRADALKMVDKLKELAKQRYVDPGAFIPVYEALGDKEEVFKLLDKCVQEKSNAAALIKVDPIFDSLRADPRYLEVVKRVGLSN